MEYRTKCWRIMARSSPKSTPLLISRPARGIQKRTVRWNAQFKLWNTCLGKLKISTELWWHTVPNSSKVNRTVYGKKNLHWSSYRSRATETLVATTWSSSERKMLPWKLAKRRILTSATSQRIFQTSSLEDEFAYQTRELKGRFWTKLAPHGLSQ